MLAPWTIRMILAVGAGLSGLLLVYASIVPLDYVPLEWDLAVERFRKVSWLKLPLDRRADWVANALVVIPSSFLAMGAIDWKRPSRGLSFLLFPFVVALISTLVVAIEFLQVWFPGRTLSQNDIAAGVAGAVLGSTLWMLCGRLIGTAIERFFQLERGGPRLGWLVVAYAIGLAVYSLLPMDLVLGTGEWKEKYAAGRLTIVPFTDLKLSRASLIAVCLTIAKMIPIGFATRHVLSPKKAIGVIMGYSLMIEGMQAPIFTRFASSTDVILGWIGGAIGWLMAGYTKDGVRLARYRVSWIAAFLGWSLMIVVAFVGRFERMATGEELGRRFDGIWSMPLVRYYFASEFEAGANLAGKIIVFAILGFFLTGWIHAPIPARGQKLSIVFAALWVLMLGAIIEGLQILLLPFVPEANDIVIYAVGAIAGAIIYGVLFFKASIQQATD